MMELEKTITENIGVTLGKQEREISKKRREEKKNFVQRLNGIKGLVVTYMDATHSLKWETREMSDVLTVRIMGKKYRTRHLEFHGTGQRAFFVFTLPNDELEVFTEQEAETLEIL